MVKKYNKITDSGQYVVEMRLCTTGNVDTDNTLVGYWTAYLESEGYKGIFTRDLYLSILHGKRHIGSSIDKINKTVVNDISSGDVKVMELQETRKKCLRDFNNFFAPMAGAIRVVKVTLID